MASIAQALAKRTVQTVPIDPATGMPVTADPAAVARALTNYPQLAPRPGFGPVQGSKVNRGQWSEFMQPQNWPTDQTVQMNHLPTATAAISPDAQLDSPPLAAYGEVPTNPGEKAIVEALIRGGNKMSGSAFTPGGWGSNGFGRPRLQWEDVATPGPAPTGDPWKGIRIPAATLSGTKPKQGLVVGPKAGPSKAVELHARLSQPGYNGKTVLRSNELAGTNSSVFSENTVLPQSMNTKRWLTGY